MKNKVLPSPLVSALLAVELWLACSSCLPSLSHAFVPQGPTTSALIRFHHHHDLSIVRHRRTHQHQLPVRSWQEDLSRRSTPHIAVATRQQAQSKNDNDTVGDDDGDESSSSNSSWLWTLVLPLWLVYISNQWSRSSIYYLVQFDGNDATADAAFTAMNVDIGFDEAQYGVLASVAFTSLFAVASLGAGWASDRFNRKTLTIVSAASWSLAVWGTAAADSYETVLACRIAMGLACAFATPTAYTLIRDRVPPAQAATASSFYGTGVALGSGLASLTILLDNAVGWRGALDAIAVTGLAAVVLSLVVLPDDEKEDENENEKQPNQKADTSTTTTTTAAALDASKEQGEGLASILGDVGEAFTTDRAKLIYLGSFLRFCSGLCIGVWSAPYFRMVFDDRSSDYALAQAAISAIGASASGVLGGAIADRLSSSATEGGGVDAIGRRLWVPVVGSLLAAPTWYLAMHSPESFEISMAWLAAEYFVAECWFGPTISTLQSTVGTKVGGTAQGLFTLTGAFANFAPALVGYIYGQSVGGDAAEQVAAASASSTELSGLLSAVVCACYLASAFCFYLAASASPSPPTTTNETKVL